MRRASRAAVLKDPEIVIAVSEIVATIHLREYFQSKCIAPKPDRLLQVACAYTDMYKDT
jgi:hypothetical protein